MQHPYQDSLPLHNPPPCTASPSHRRPLRSTDKEKWWQHSLLMWRLGCCFSGQEGKSTAAPPHKETLPPPLLPVAGPLSSTNEEKQQGPSLLMRRLSCCFSPYFDSTSGTMLHRRLMKLLYFLHDYLFDFFLMKVKKQFTGIVQGTCIHLALFVLQ